MRLDEQAPSEDLRLERYLAGECTPEEEGEVRAWVSGLAGNSDALALMESAFLQQRQLPGFSESEAYDRLRKRIHRTADQRGSSRQTVRRSMWYTLTAVVASVMVFAAGWKLSGAHMFGSSVSSELTYTTYATANGERATITLADGNTIALNVASRLEVPTNYGKGNHVVRLPAGEALFTVSHHTGAPFTVIAGPATARVLGTSFVVRHYSTDTTAIVAVKEGKVAVDSMVVTNQRLIEVGRSGVIRAGAASPSRFAFATGIIAFDGTPLSAAIVELNRWYDADVRLEDPALATRLLKGKFASGSLADLATILEMTFDVRAVRDGKVIHLYPSR